jgi:type IV secretory pathway VirB3-like protein
MASERPQAGVGCLGSLLGVLILVAVVVTVIFVGFIALGVVAVLVVIGLLALAVDRVMLALSPKRRERRANQARRFGWQSGLFSSGQVIDTSAIDTTATPDEPKWPEPGPDELKPE